MGKAARALAVGSQPLLATDCSAMSLTDYSWTRESENCRDFWQGASVHISLATFGNN